MSERGQLVVFQCAAGHIYFVQHDRCGRCNKELTASDTPTKTPTSPAAASNTPTHTPTKTPEGQIE